MELGPHYTGAHTVEGPMTVVEVWQSLHSNAKEWEHVPHNTNFFKIREILDQSDRETLARLVEFDATLWEHLCFGAGWTVMGAVGLSWCKDSAFETVAREWEGVSPDLTPDVLTLRAASMICPVHMPLSNKLSDIATALDGDPFRIGLVIAAQKEVIDIDVAPSELSDIPASLAPMVDYMLSDAREPT